jgi:hypothetical protein
MTIATDLVEAYLFNPVQPEAGLTSGLYIPKGYQGRSPCLVRHAIVDIRAVRIP